MKRSRESLARLHEHPQVALTIATARRHRRTSCVRSYRGGPLNEGDRDGDVVTCSWHGPQFDLCFGEVLRGLAREPSSDSRPECVKGS
jgi:nitrite reductase/ring-hydroxylating ferredoxin subunit